MHKSCTKYTKGAQKAPFFVGFFQQSTVPK